MAKYCSQCGFSLSATAAFCGGCGEKVVSACPTCGQELPAGHELLNEGKANKEPTEQSRVKIKKNRDVGTGTYEPIYGNSYDEDEDCPNCGAKGQNDRICNKCDEDNS